MKVGLISSVLSMTQVCNVGTHTERSCRRISLHGPKAVEIGYSPARYLIKNHVRTGRSSVRGRNGKDLPSMMTDTLVTHTMIAIVTTNLFLSQMAMLEASMSASFGERWPVLEEWKGTYMRKITKREAVTRPR
jgi:hypothetical protein